MSTSDSDIITVNVAAEGGGSFIGEVEADFQESDNSCGAGCTSARIAVRLRR